MATTAHPSRLDSEFQSLVRERYGDDPSALTDLAVRLITGREAPLAPEDGCALISRAMELGHGSACSRMAVLAASGTGRPQSWTDALRALECAARLGANGAARELALLQAHGLSTSDALEAWIAEIPAVDVLHDSPRIVTIGRLLPPTLCEHLKGHAKPRLAEAQVYDAVRGGLKLDAMRTNTTAAYSVTDTDFIMQLVRARIARAAQTQTTQLEPLEILHYAVGERYRPHVDFFHPALPNFSSEMRLRGQRTRTCLVYLNDDYDGGETEFPKCGVRFRGAPGDALLFDNVLPNGTGDMRTLHQGLPPTRGEKWLLSQWMRNKRQPLA